MSRHPVQFESPARCGFTLIEVMMVVMVVGILAAIALPLFSRGAVGAGDSALTSDLAQLRTAIENYATDHKGAFPTAANFTIAITKYSDSSGSISSTSTATAIYGPYMGSIPVVPVGARKGSSGVAAADGSGIGWIFNQSTGVIVANTTTETDVTGKLYNAY